MWYTFFCQDSNLKSFDTSLRIGISSLAHKAWQSSIYTDKFQSCSSSEQPRLIVGGTINQGCSEEEKDWILSRLSSLIGLMMKYLSLDSGVQQ